MARGQKRCGGGGCNPFPAFPCAGFVSTGCGPCQKPCNDPCGFDFACGPCQKPCNDNCDFSCDFCKSSCENPCKPDCKPCKCGPCEIGCPSSFECCFSECDNVCVNTCSVDVPCTPGVPKIEVSCSDVSFCEPGPPCCPPKPPCGVPCNFRPPRPCKYFSVGPNSCSLNCCQNFCQNCRFSFSQVCCQKKTCGGGCEKKSKTGCAPCGERKVHKEVKKSRQVRQSIKSSKHSAHPKQVVAVVEKKQKERHVEKKKKDRCGKCEKKKPCCGPCGKMQKCCKRGPPFRVINTNHFGLPDPCPPKPCPRAC